MAQPEGVRVTLSALIVNLLWPDSFSGPPPIIYMRRTEQIWTHKIKETQHAVCSGAPYERRLKNVALGRFRRSVEKRGTLAALAVFGSHWELVRFPCELKAARAIKGVYGHGEVGGDSTSGQGREA